MAITTKGKINIAVIGAVSAGKTTLVNGLFVKKFGDMKMKRTTALPQLYHATGGKIDEAGAIYAVNAKRNKEIMDKTAAGEALTLDAIKEIDYIVDPIPEVFPLHKGVFAVVHDLPGLNDAKTKTVYMAHINKNFHRYAVVFFVIGIDSALNTSDEMDILNMILTNIAACATKGMLITLLVFINKCDEMIKSKTEPDGLDVSDDELKDQVKQIHTIVEKQREFHNVDVAQIAFVKISSEEIFLFRMCAENRFDELDDKHVTKVGINEMGKRAWATTFDTPKKRIAKVREIMKERKQADAHKDLMLCGFAAIRVEFEKCLQNTSQRQYLVNEIIWDMNLITDFRKADIGPELKQFAEIRSRVDEIGRIFSATHVWMRVSHAKIDTYVAEFKKNYAAHNQTMIDTKHTTQSITVDVYNAVVAALTSMIGLMYESKGAPAPADAENVKKLRANISLYYLRIFAAATTSYDEFMKTLRLVMDGGYIEGDLRRELDEKIMVNLYTGDNKMTAENVDDMIRIYCIFTKQLAIKFLWANALLEMARAYKQYFSSTNNCDTAPVMRAKLLLLRQLSEGVSVEPEHGAYILAIGEYGKMFSYCYHPSGSGIHICSACIAKSTCAIFMATDNHTWQMTTLFITHITAA